jgi:hypothetical protein
MTSILYDVIIGRRGGKKISQEAETITIPGDHSLQIDLLSNIQVGCKWTHHPPRGYRLILEYLIINQIAARLRTITGLQKQISAVRVPPWSSGFQFKRGKFVQRHWSDSTEAPSVAPFFDAIIAHGCGRFVNLILHN